LILEVELFWDGGSTVLLVFIHHKQVFWRQNKTSYLYQIMALYSEKIEQFMSSKS